MIILSMIACYSQTDLDKMKGFWQNLNEESVMDYYNGNTYRSFLYSEKKTGFIGGKYPSTVGFYNTCEVPLKNHVARSAGQ